ncbi:thermonuclease family protein [Nitrospira sp. Kam-Ns4a]
MRRRSGSLEAGPWAGFFALLDDERAQVLDRARIRVLDGDTFVYGSQKIRIKGFDAPELLEPGGFEAMKRLDELLHEGQVMMVPDAVDAYGRLVAYVYVDQNSVAETMKLEGHEKPGRR